MNSEGVRPRRSPLAWGQFLYVTFYIGLVVVGLYCGYLAYDVVRTLASRTQFRSVPIVPVRLPPSVDDSLAAAQPRPVANAPQGQFLPRTQTVYPNIETPERVNILFLGIDQRPGEPVACRTDTMILVSINPRDMSASVLSIPRDLWVDIYRPSLHGYEKGKINTAHYWGEIEHYPGGGPALAKYTIRYNFGVPVDYYVRLNFTGFERIIDTIGGIDIDVPTTIDDPRYPNGSYGYEHLHIEAGRHHFDGEMALKYARTRHGAGDGDFTRMERQQQVIMAVRDRVLSMENLPQLVRQIPSLYREMGDSLETDIPLDVMITLARWGQQIDRDKIRMERIDRRMTRDGWTPDGQAVLIFEREKARPIIDDLFRDPTPEAESTSVNPVERLEKEGARVAVYNGTDVYMLAARTASFLEIQGLQIVRCANADRDYERTVINVYTAKPYTVRWLKEWLITLGVSDPQVRSSAEKGDVDITIVIGRDFPANKIK